MVFVKVLKNKAFFRRFQVQKKRRREGKTDFYARRKMVRQDKNKFNNRKYRLIVRFTNRKCICQIAYATIRGDMVVAQATSTELSKYGVHAGHKNYSCAYLTGLLIARRVLKQFGLDDDFKGKEKTDGEDYHVEDEETEGEKRPLKAILDVGLRRTTMGARMWGALKGAVDGGLHVPHNNKNFPGYTAPEEKGQDPQYEAEAHKDRIFAKHVSEYMEMLQEEDPQKYEVHFSKYIKNGMEPDKMEDIIGGAIEKIKGNPEYEPAADKGITHNHIGNRVTSSDGTEHRRSVKLTLKQRRAKVAHKISTAQEKMLAAAGDD